MMKMLLTTAVALFAAAPAFAYSRAVADPIRVYSSQMACQDAQALVAQEGHVVFYSSPFIYERFVASQDYCANRSSLSPAWIATADTDACFVGYTCGPYNPEH